VAEVPSGESFLWIVYLAVVCSIGGFLFYNYGLRGLSSSGATNILNIVPVFGVISAVVIAGERTQLTQIVGGLIVLVGVVIGARERPDPGPDPVIQTSLAPVVPTDERESVDMMAAAGCGNPESPLAGRKGNMHV
jgi:hypothetical protein